MDDPSTAERAKLKLLAIRLHCLAMPHGGVQSGLARF